MTETYLAKYKEDVSESSIVTDEEPNKGMTPKEAQTNSAPPVQTKPENTRKREQVAFYTFDPKSVLSEMNAPTSASKYSPTKIATESTNYKPIINYGSSTDYSYGALKKTAPLPGPSMTSASFAQRQQDMSYLTTLGDDFRKTEDYKGFSKEFEKEFDSGQKEMEHVSNELMNRTKKLDAFIKELQSADLDMILFRNRLIREIQDVENDLKEAYNNILVLMGDRSNMKDQFCVFKMKIKKLKGFVKTFQDDIQA